MSSLWLAITGASVVPVALIERMGDELAFTTVFTTYDLTESTGAATICRAHDAAVIIGET